MYLFELSYHRMTIFYIYKTHNLNHTILPRTSIIEMLEYNITLKIFSIKNYILIFLHIFILLFLKYINNNKSHYLKNRELIH
jgi:hypothetical protein